MSYQPDPNFLTELSAAAHVAVDQIVQAYRTVPDGPVLKTPSASTLSSIRALVQPDEHSRSMTSVVQEACDSIYPWRMTMQHPKAMCFIPAPVSPVAWLADILMQGHNAFAGSWYQSPGPSAVEKELIEWLAARAGFDRSRAGGLFVSGGSMANLIPLVAARDEKLGTTDPMQRARGTAYVSEQTHSSVSKALRIAGLLDSQIRKVRADASFKMDLSDLRRQIEADISQGSQPFVVIASLGTTNTGSIDDLDAIAAISREFGLWMHVDGAYGASVILSKNHAHLAKGLGNADSCSWDAHKWLFQTYDTGIILVKDRNALLRSFVNSAEYLRDAMATPDQPNFWDFGLELTRPARHMKLWLTMRVLGTDTLGKMIDKGFYNAEAAQRRLEQLSDWTIVSPAQMAIVVFRFVPPNLDEKALDELNSAVSKEVVETNTALILTTMIGGKRVMRIVTIHPDLDEKEMVEMIDRVDEIARRRKADLESESRDRLE